MGLRLRVGRGLYAALAAAAVVIAPARSALAWVDVHVEADDVRVALDRTGEAKVEHRITLRIAGGPLKSFDIRGVDTDAAPDKDGYVVPQRDAEKSSLASAVGAIAERLPPDLKPRPDGAPAPTVLRVRFDDDRGLRRGVYVLFVRYATHLAAKVPPGGSLARVAWRGPTWDDGLDSAHVTFDLPAAPTEPRVDDTGGEAEPGAQAPLFLSTVRRGVSRDQIELLRPYAPKGEPITWAIRADARALQPPAPPPPAVSVRAAVEKAISRSAERALLVGGAIALFVFYSVLVAMKSAQVARAARAAGVAPRPLVPLPAVARAILAGAALVAGLFVQLVLSRATPGALLVLGALSLASHRTPRWPRTAPRGPGRWLPVAEATALAPPPRPRGAILDVSTRGGKIFLLTLLAAVGAVVFHLYDTWPYKADLIAFDTAALLAVFCTGRLAELPPDPRTAPVRLLRKVARRLSRALPRGEARLVGRIRVPEGGTEPDEIRLAVVPRAAPAGFGAIEIGVVYVRGAGGPIALPEVVLRVTSGSPCEAAIEGLAQSGRSSRGRRAGERAIVFSPRLPTARMTAGLCARLVRALATARAHGAKNAASREARRAA